MLFCRRICHNISHSATLPPLGLNGGDFEDISNFHLYGCFVQAFFHGPSFARERLVELRPQGRESFDADEMWLTVHTRRF